MSNKIKLNKLEKHNSDKNSLDKLLSKANKIFSKKDNNSDLDDLASKAMRFSKKSDISSNAIDTDNEEEIIVNLTIEECVVENEITEYLESSVEDTIVEPSFAEHEIFTKENIQKEIQETIKIKTDIPFEITDHESHIKLMRIVKRGNKRNLVIEIYKDCIIYEELTSLLSSHFKINDYFNSTFNDGMLLFTKETLNMYGREYYIQDIKIENL